MVYMNRYRIKIQQLPNMRPIFKHTKYHTQVTLNKRVEPNNKEQQQTNDF